MHATKGIVEDGEFVILGITTDGSNVKSSEWDEKLCHSLGRLGSDGYTTYPSYVHPVLIEGVKCVVVHASVCKDNPAAFDLIKRFIAEHLLMTRAGRSAWVKMAETGANPVFFVERRDPENNKWRDSVK